MEWSLVCLHSFSHFTSTKLAIRHFCPEHFRFRRVNTFFYCKLIFRSSICSIFISFWFTSHRFSRVSAFLLVVLLISLIPCTFHSTVCAGLSRAEHKSIANKSKYVPQIICTNWRKSTIKINLLRIGLEWNWLESNGMVYAKDEDEDKTAEDRRWLIYIESSQYGKICCNSTEVQIDIF